MKLPNSLLASVTASAVLLLFSSQAWAESAQLGNISFVADTNVRMFHFAGQAQKIQSSVVRNGDELTKLELRIPVSQLSTGIEIRDKHMRERIFTAADGSTPDIVYSANQSSCKRSSSSQETCLLNGQLSFRGETHSQPVQLTLENGKEASGSVKIDVKSWGVKDQQLSYTGIAVDPIVRVEFSVSLQ